MQRLNLPSFPFRVKNTQKGIAIFDEFRKIFVTLQPEEWVRQHVLHYVHHHKGYPKGRIGVEKQIGINGLIKRFDILIYDDRAKPLILVECKAPEVTITQQSFDQIAQYNQQLNAPYLMVTNGLQHFYCQMNFKERRYDFLKDIPQFSR